MKNYIYYNLKIYNDINIYDDKNIIIYKYLKDNGELKNYLHKQFLDSLYDRLNNKENIEFKDDEYIYLNYDIYNYVIKLNIDDTDLKNKLNIL